MSWLRSSLNNEPCVGGAGSEALSVPFPIFTPPCCSRVVLLLPPNCDRCCALLAFASCVEVPTVFGGVAGEGEGGGKEEVDLVELAETSHAVMQVTGSLLAVV